MFLKKLKISPIYIIEDNLLFNQKLWNYNILKKNDIKIMDFKKNYELKLHFLNLYYLSKQTPISPNKLFFFTSPNLIFNMIFFYQYQFELWILKLIFLKINIAKWLNVYFCYKLQIGNQTKLFFNLKNFFNKYNFSCFTG